MQVVIQNGQQHLVRVVAVFPVHDAAEVMAADVAGLLREGLSVVVRDQRSGIGIPEIWRVCGAIPVALETLLIHELPGQKRVWQTSFASAATSFTSPRTIDICPRVSSQKTKLTRFNVGSSIGEASQADAHCLPFGDGKSAELRADVDGCASDHECHRRVRRRAWQDVERERHVAIRFARQVDGLVRGEIDRSRPASVPGDRSRDRRPQRRSRATATVGGKSQSAPVTFISAAVISPMRFTRRGWCMAPRPTL